MKVQHPISIKEAAKILNVSHQRVYKMISEGVLRPIIDGHGKQLDKYEVERVGEKVRTPVSAIFLDKFKVSEIRLPEDPRMLPVVRASFAWMIETHMISLQRDLDRLSRCEQRARGRASIEYFASEHDKEQRIQQLFNEEFEAIDKKEWYANYTVDGKEKSNPMDLLGEEDELIEKGGE